jgi:hypothetical protein
VAALMRQGLPLHEIKRLLVKEGPKMATAHDDLVERLAALFARECLPRVPQGRRALAKKILAGVGSAFRNEAKKPCGKHAKTLAKEP